MRTSSVVGTNNGSRPRYEIDEEQQFDCSSSGQLQLLAQIFGICDRTLRRKREEFTARTESFSDISEADLCEVIESIRFLTPNIGQSHLLGARRCRGFTIQR
ncbi:Hypothetical predicted protein [Paramuricea clavata]|uniref:Uncharacterized protein n=1 Tax=Paramuricea clavata TaxID=317549 RepID=A0A6S7HBG3_PARCT|nr:Hypothetical predicted protein [Paramuricea clavata]